MRFTLLDGESYMARKLGFINWCNISCFIAYNLHVNHVFDNTTNQLIFTFYFSSLDLDLSPIQAASTRHSCGG